MTQEFVTLPREVVEQALDAWARGCPPDCKDGMTDSGGVHPWGEAALIECPSCQAVEALSSALEQPQDHVPDAGNMVPEGWKLVPVDPNEAMHRAAVRTVVHCTGNDDFPPAVYRAMLDAAPQPPASKDPNWPKLEKPARVGGGTFGIGTSSKHVVDAAQRAHDEHVRAGNLTHEQMAEEERKRRALWDMINGSPEESKPKFVWQAQGEQGTGLLIP